MADVPLVVASAVIFPEPEQRPASPPANLKRRASSPSTETSKRPRLSPLTSNNDGPKTTASLPRDQPEDRTADRRKSGQLEERKRGKRLFGALLGTLSQSSSSTALNRRSEIEKKQLAKLRLQAEEDDEKKRLKREELTKLRMIEQVKYDKQSMNIRHSNMLAQAHFLQTKSQPKLYYKPWEMLPSQEERIKTQIVEAEAAIEKESETWDFDHPAEKKEEPAVAGAKNEETSEPANTNGDTVGPFTDKDKAFSPQTTVEDTNMGDHDACAPETIETIMKPNEPPEGSKDHHDEGDDVVEGEEDTVIY
ncbi:hypothetical protein MMC21_005135 [Puttea exsequens]|nr:hypothetical protein [Puttea exsequens]